MQRYYIGSTPKLYAYTKVDPGTSMTITIKDPKGKVIVNDAAMTKEDVGVYYYAELELTADHLEGDWLYKCTARTLDFTSVEVDNFKFVKE